jgi:hypothetical protein
MASELATNRQQAHYRPHSSLASSDIKATPKFKRQQHGSTNNNEAQTHHEKDSYASDGNGGRPDGEASGELGGV